MAQPQMRTSAPTGSPNAAKVGQLTGDWARRLTSGRGSTPFRLRGLLIATILFAIVFAVLGAYGVGKRRSAIDAANHAATQLLALQDIRINVVQADSVASRLYLTGGAEDPGERSDYVDFIAQASSGLVEVALQLEPGGSQAAALQSANDQLTTYTGLIEQARANNRQGFPVGAAYQREANDVANDLVGQLRIVEQGQRDAVNDELAAAHRAGAWLALSGWVLVGIIVLACVWLAVRFHRLVNAPLGLGLVAVVVVLLLATFKQGTAISDADDAVSGALTTADLVAQAQASAYDAVSNEALTLINRGNGQQYEDNWTHSSDVVDQALREASDRGATGAGTLATTYDKYRDGHQTIRDYDNAGDWDDAVAISLGRDYGEATVSDDELQATVVPFGNFAEASAQLVDESSAAATSALAAATDGLGLMRVLVFLTGMLVIVMAALGYGQRLREYR